MVESKAVEGKTGGALHRRARGDHRWEGVEQLPYKEDDRALFKSVTRQVLFSDSELHGELRYFEVAAGGFSTLERHAHMHPVLILPARGHSPIGAPVQPPHTPPPPPLPPLPSPH